MRRVDGVLVVLAVQGSLFVKQDIIGLACIDTLKNNSSRCQPLQPALQCTRSSDSGTGVQPCAASNNSEQDELCTAKDKAGC